MKQIVDELMETVVEKKLGDIVIETRGGKIFNFFSTFQCHELGVLLVEYS